MVEVSIFNLSESGYVKRERKRQSIDAYLYSYHLCLSDFCIFFSFFSFLSCSTSSSLRSLRPPLLFTATTFYTICHSGIYHFYRLTAFDSLQVSFQDCPLACRLLNHYHCFECVGCTTLHSQTKLLVLFLTSLYFLTTPSR